MAANLKEAVANFKAQASSYQAMFDLAEHLNDIGLLEQRAAEAEGRIAATADIEAKVVARKAELADVEKKLTATNDKLAATKAELADIEAKLSSARKQVAALLG